MLENTLETKRDHVNRFVIRIYNVFNLKSYRTLVIKEKIETKFCEMY